MILFLDNAVDAGTSSGGEHDHSHGDHHEHHEHHDHHGVITPWEKLYFPKSCQSGPRPPVSKTI